MSGWKTLCCAAIVALVTSVGAHADQWDKKTILTFSGPVQIPGATLPAGSYVFKLADLSGNRHVVQVFDKAEKKIYATLLAIPNQRLEPSDDPVVLFSERPAGSPQAVKVWFYPGERIGNEFVYPRKMAMAIAKANHEPVLAMNDSTPSDAYKTAQVGRFDDRGVWKADSDNGAVASNTTETKAPETTSAKASTSASQTATTDTSRNASVGTSGAARRHLPRTASPLPLYELLSGLSLAGGLLIRRLR